MTSNTETTSRTTHLLALMTRGDDLFNARDWQALDDVHHPDMSRVHPRERRAYLRPEGAWRGDAAAGADVPRRRVHTPYPIQFGGDNWITVVTNATGRSQER